MEQLINSVYQFIPILIPALISFYCTNWIRPYILKVSIDKNIVDNPDTRKLQRTPIPVLGGLTVIFGVLTGVMAFGLFGEYYDMFPIFASIIIILIVGLIDDMISLSPKIRFIVEIILVLYLIYTTGLQINDFHGLWGVNIISNYISIPLTVFACVGIINAINLIDGVDGYSSGYSIVCCILFGTMFYILGNIRMVALATIVAMALIPFFFHNVFGKKSKMFIGDAGTLSLGIVFSIFVTAILSSSTKATFNPNLGLIPFTLAVLCIPIFDTLRVMSTRILRGKSPFSPDKTHLHHMFIDLGFSHIGTTLSIISMNLFVVLCWFIVHRIGLSINVQLYVVILLGLFITFILYPFIRSHIHRNTMLYYKLHKLGCKSHFQHTSFWLRIQKWIDK
ncbi:MAG: undecaprenyl/decaprenyl-phosphate alpha-N-acetylglucosaminyl 1-phosphate transferase [Alistipes sp.]|nr:undecaprenyl/decaprenyl-phosphate alpha-N-acetylglucosaminyl 1-phosphate transferase [Alistipes sp.]